jgi:molybdenum cofactor biosynthesis protein A
MVQPQQIIDNHGRPITYVRLAVTDRCNLRCFYCMPEEGIDYLPRQQLLTYEEMERLLRVLAARGVSKVRITGGEPFLRKDLMPFLHRVKAIAGIEEIHITTNGVLTLPHVPELRELGIKSINLSLDTLDRDRFFRITRRDELDKVMATFHALLQHQIPVKINAVVMEGQNTEDIVPLARLAELYPVAVRFIEEMPFNGGTNKHPVLAWNHHRILQELRSAYPGLHQTDKELYATAENFVIPGHAGSLGIIAAYSRTFCGTCNRIRITAQGGLKTCLYGNDVLNTRDIIRSGVSDETLAATLLDVFGRRAKDGYEAEANSHLVMPGFASMSTIGG